MSGRPPWLPRHYFLDYSDPDVFVLRRQDGSFVAAFSARGATMEGILKAAEEDHRALVREQGASSQPGDTARERPSTDG